MMVYLQLIVYVISKIVGLAVNCMFVIVSLQDLPPYLSQLDVTFEKGNFIIFKWQKNRNCSTFAQVLSPYQPMEISLV